MLTKAGKQAIAVMPVCNGQNTSPNTVPMFPTDSIRNTSNQERWISYVSNALFNTFAFTNNAANSGFHLGSGTTAPTENDYKMETDITSNVTCTLASTSRGVDSNGKQYMEFVYTVTNTAASGNMTIGECGLVSSNINCCTSASATSASGNNILIDRTVLATPITIAPQGSAALKYRITCDMSFS